MGLVADHVLLELVDGVGLQPLHVLPIEAHFLLGNGLGNLLIAEVQLMGLAIFLDFDEACRKLAVEQQALLEEFVVLLGVLAVVEHFHYGRDFSAVLQNKLLQKLKFPVGMVQQFSKSLLSHVLTLGMALLLLLE